MLKEKFDPWASLDPANDGASAYRGDPIGYITEHLGMEITDDQRRVCQAVAEHDFVVVQSSTSVGKSFLLGLLNWYFFDAYKDRGPQIYNLAAPPERNLKYILWPNIMEVKNIMGASFFGLRDRDCKDESIERPGTKEFITRVTIPRNGTESDQVATTSGKHAPVLVFIVDEADAVPDPVFKGIDGCLSGGVVAKCICCFNPKSTDNYVAGRIADGTAHVVEINAFNHPNVINDDPTIIPGAVKREFVVKSISLWAKPADKVDFDVENPPAKYFELPDYLVGEQYIKPNGEELPPLVPGWYEVLVGDLSYKVLGKFPPGGENQLIPVSSYEESVANWYLLDLKKAEYQSSTKPVVGVDVGDEGGDASAVAIGYGPWVESVVELKGRTLTQLGRDCFDIALEVGASELRFDAIGVGAGCVPAAIEHQTDKQELWDKGERMGMNIEPRLINVFGVKLNRKLTKYGTNRDKAYWLLRLAIIDGRLYVPPSQKLRRQLMTVQYSESGGKTVVTSKRSLKSKLGYSPNEMEAILILNYGSGVYAGSV